MVYKINPANDRVLAEEFRLTPVGHHSPNLMRVLNIMRYDPSGYQTILVNKIPFKEWVLGVMPPDRKDDIALDESRIFTDRNDAEWAVFCARWEAHTGEKITTSRHEPLI